MEPCQKFEDAVSCLYIDTISFNKIYTRQRILQSAFRYLGFIVILSVYVNC